MRAPCRIRARAGGAAEEDCGRRREDRRTPDQQKLQDLIDRKRQLQQGVGQLEQQLDQASQSSRRDQPEASRQFREAANSIRDNRLKEKIDLSQRVVRERAVDYARALEKDIGEDFEQLQNRLETATTAAGQQSKDQRLSKSLEDARNLSRSLQSMTDRTRESQFQRDSAKAGAAVCKRDSKVRISRVSRGSSAISSSKVVSAASKVSSKASKDSRVSSKDSRVNEDNRVNKVSNKGSKDNRVNKDSKVSRVVSAVG
jgi:hypothetical protein